MELIILGVDSLLVSTIFYFYRKKTRMLLNVQNAIEFEPNGMNKDEAPSVIEYAMISGTVKPVGEDLASHYNTSCHGVIRVLEIKEHGTRMANNIVTDTTKIISKVVNEVPFNVVQKNLAVKVENPLEANYLLDDLTLAYKTFEPSNENFASKVMSAIISREAVKGIETTETMLLNNSTLTCFGKLEKIEPTSVSAAWLPKLKVDSFSKLNYRLTKPTVGGHSYILTTLSRKALIFKLEDTTKLLKFFLILFGSLGAGLGVYIAYNSLSTFIQQKRREYQIEQARIQRRKLQRERARTIDLSNNREEPAHNESSSCVICLTNPREIVLLDCGHVCLCMDCLELLPSKNCPICRVVYRTFAPCYIP